MKRCAAALDERRAKYDPAGLDAQLRQLLRLAPALRHARLIRTWSGVEGYMADDLPVMGEVLRPPAFIMPSASAATVSRSGRVLAT